MLTNYHEKRHLVKFAQETVDVKNEFLEFWKVNFELNLSFFAVNDQIIKDLHAFNE